MSSNDGITDSSSAANSLLSKAREYTSGKFGVIPVNYEKRPALHKGEINCKRGRVASSEELVQYFGSCNDNTRTVGIGLLLDKSEFTIDTDGRGELVFQNRVASKLLPNLQSKINSTMCTKTPHGYHRTFRYKAANDDGVIRTRTYWSLEGGHNEIAVKGKDHYSIEYCPGYQEIRGIKYLIALSNDETTELLSAMSLLKLQMNIAENVAKVLKEYYKEPKRNNLTFAIAGFLHKARVPEEIIADMIERLALSVRDERLESRLQVVSNTCAKDWDSAEVSGYERLLDELDCDSDALDKVKSILQMFGYGYPDVVSKQSKNSKKSRSKTKSKVAAKDDGNKDEAEGKNTEDDENDGDEVDENDELQVTKITKNQIALRLVMENVQELFTDQFGDAYAAIKVNEHIETLRIKGSRFGNWLAKVYYENTSDVLGTENIKNVRSVVEAQAEFDGVQRKLYLRVGNIVYPLTGLAQSDTIYYDLANKDWQVVKITEDGWQLEQSPIIFRRYGSTGIQVIPSKEYPEDIFDQFISLINVKTDEQKLLLKCYIIALFVPEIPKPIQMLYGEQGAAKTSEQEAIKDLVDPSPILTVTFPRDINELVQKLMHNYVCYFDNISFIQPWVSDQLCRAVTGGGFSKRDLYSDDNDIIYNFRRCIGFNGVNLAATKADLLDRGLIMQLERIPEDKRLRDAVVKEYFAKIKPQLLGYIFDVLVKVLRFKKNTGGIQIDGYPRMADFAEIGETISRCMGYKDNEFINAYYKNINTLTDEAIASHPVASAILKFMEDKTEWTCTMTELYIELENIAVELMIDTANKMWPKSPAMLSRRINEVKTNLRAKGIVIEEAFVDTAKGVRGIRVCKIATVSTVSAVTRGTVNNGDEEITKGIGKSVVTVGTVDTAGTLHTQEGQPTAKSQREGISWSGSKWYCQYCKNNGDRFFMKDHICSKSKVKAEKKNESVLGDRT